MSNLSKINLNGETYNIQDTVSGYTTNTGTVTSVKVGTTSYSPSSGVVSLPAYPTSLPASDTVSTYSSTGTAPINGTGVAAALATLPEPMVFKGSLGTGGTITALPVNGTATVGDTYKVITAGTYASQAAKVGDTFICDSKTSSANTWVLIPSGDEPSGTVTSVAAGTGLDGGTITTSGTLSVKYGTAAGTACEGNDSRLSNARTPTSHTHGNIQNGGTLQTNDITIASGDKLVVTDSSDSAKVARTSISFDGSTTTKCLTQKGTWETFGTSNLTIGTTATTALAGNTKYAGASTAGGSATSAAKLDTSTAGSATNPVYFSDGVPTACTYSLNKTVPSTAVFTDTTYTIDCTSSGILSLTPSTGTTQWFQIPYATKSTYFSGGGRGSETEPVYFNDDGAPTKCSYSLNKTVPSNAVFTDSNVTQTATTTDAAYELLFSATADNTTRTEGARKTDSLKYNPSTKEMTLDGTIVLNGYTRSTSTDPCPSIILKANNIDTDTAVTARTYGNSEINVHDKDGDRLGFVNWFKDADGSIGFTMSAQNKSTGGTTYYNTLEMKVDKTGNKAYSISDPSAFRTAINTTTCSFTKSISSLAGATIVRRGNVVTLEFGHQITSAGSYTNIGTVSPAPIETLHFVVNCGDTWKLARITTSGVVSFNNATSVAANDYLIGSVTYITAS